MCNILISFQVLSKLEFIIRCLYEKAKMQGSSTREFYISKYCYSIYERNLELKRRLTNYGGLSGTHIHIKVLSELI